LKYRGLSTFDYCNANQKAIRDQRLLIGGCVALPEKEYFTLEELAKRWGTDLGSLQHYAEHNLLEVQAWLGSSAAKVYQTQETRHGDRVPVQVGLTDYKDYALLEPDEVRQVFRHGKRAIGKFLALDRSLLYKPLDAAKCQVEVSDLVVSKKERDRFEKRYALNLAMSKPKEATESQGRHVGSFSGRPSVMFRIEEEMRRRAASGTMESSLKREAEQLHSWAALTIKDHQVPQPGSIANALRRSYLQLKEHQYA
jgi:hypothetical protein